MTAQKTRKIRMKNIVAFCVLMENHSGIEGKAPSYIEEKFERLIERGLENPDAILDASNTKKYEEWLQKWMPGEVGN